MLQVRTPLLEVVIRVFILYFFLLVLVRVSGKREVGQLSPLDFLAMLLLAETVSPALTGQDESLPAAMVAALTLIGLTMMVSWLSYRSHTVERWIDGTPSALIENGTVNSEVLQSERITSQELASALRKEGLESVDEVRKAVVEPSGRITVIPKRQM